MAAPVIARIADQDAAMRAALLALNNEFARETSFLSETRWQGLMTRAFAADCIDPPAGLLIAFEHTADHGSPNFLWFRERFARFVYVDRIVVASARAGQGLARRLYLGLFAKALAAGHDRVVCEVNEVPANPRSAAFHAGLGFVPVGRGVLAGGDKTVRYLALALQPRDAAGPIG